MYDVTAIGELLIDFAALSSDSAGYPTMKANPGGAPGNFLAALNAYGARTAFLGKVGGDAFGTLLVRIPCSPLWLSSLSALKGTAPSALQGNRGLIPGFYSESWI